MTRSTFLRLLAVSALAPTPLTAWDGPGFEDVVKRIREGLARLDEIFWVPELGNWLDRPGKDLRGHFDGKINPPWWGVANLVELMIDFMNLSGTDLYDRRLREVHEANVLRGSRLPKVAEALRKAGNWSPADDEKLAKKMKALDPAKADGSEFRNEYLDDSAWWGIAWLKFHVRTRDARYLKTARLIQEHMAANWREQGGVSWGEQADKRDPNAITNSLFVVLSARLYQTTKQPAYLEWAKKAMAWEREIRLYDGIGIVDRPGHQADYWTYNQGAYAGALEALHSATGDPAWLDEMVMVTGSVLDHSGIVTDGDILYEKLSTEGWDVGLFKGICARYLATLAPGLRKSKSHAETVDRVTAVLKGSALAILRLKPSVEGLYPLEWQAPARAEIYNFNTHLSALIALAAALSNGK